MLARSSVSVVNIDDGNGVVSVDITYAIGSSPTTPPGNPLTDNGVIITDLNGVALTDASWQTTIPVVPNGYYLWTRTVTTYTDNSFTVAYVVGYSGTDGETGAQGVSITGEKEQWYVSNSNSSLTGGSWVETEPTSVPNGKYLWGRFKFTMSDGTTQYSAAVCRKVIGGLLTLANEHERKITQKVWETDIDSKIDTYDGTLQQSINERFSQIDQDLDGITSRVGATESALDGKADTTTVTSIQTQAQQTADHLSWVIEENGKTASTFTFKSRVMSLVNASLIIKDPAGSATTITGGKIVANSITTNMLATNAIKSVNYNSGVNNSDTPSGHYSVTGSFLDLSNGSLYMPNFGVDGSTGAAYFNGTVNAFAGKFGDTDIGSYWNIQTVYDYNMQAHAALVGTGSPYLQTGNWQVSDNAVATRKYTSTAETSGTVNYYKDTNSNTFYDVGMKIPTNFTTPDTSDSSTVKYNKAFYYGRKYTGNSVPSLDSDWTYFFMVDTAGNVYQNGVKLSEKYASINGVGNTYLPLSGGTVTGNLTVNGTLTGTLTGNASTATKWAAAQKVYVTLGTASTTTTIQGGSSSAQTIGVNGTLGVGNGGTGKASWNQYGIVYASTTSALTQMTVGTSGQVLTSGGSAAPSWTNQSSLAAGTATKWAAAQTVYVALGTASKTTTIQGGSTSAVALGIDGTLAVGHGGTGATTFTSGAVLIGNGTSAIQTRSIRNNTTVGALGWTASGTDNTIITTNTLAYWDGRYQTTNNASNIEYVKLGKLGTVVTHAFDEFITTSGGTISGALSVIDLTTGDLVVTGAASFTNGLSGDLTGDVTGNLSGNATTATTATKVQGNLKIQLNSGTTEGTNQFTYNGETGKTVNITKGGLGLANVENTALSTWAGSANLTTTKVGTLAAAAAKGVDTSISAGSSSANLPTSAAVASFVESKGYVTSSGVTSIQVSATSPVVSSVNTASTTTLSTTISLADAYGDTKNPYASKTANYFLAAPNGSNGAPTFRAIVAADIPTLAASKVGLGNVTNNKQVKGLSSGTTSGHIVTWGSDGYTVADGGIAKGSLATKVTLAGSDYSASSNTITITQANLQSAVQSTSLLLMTSAERSKLASIQVSEGGTIDFSGVTASSPLTATVASDKTVNITHNTSGVTASTYRSVTVNTYGHVTAGTNPTTLSGYGITDAKIASGIITLGSNTITPLTASSTLDATKLSGTASISTTGNATSASKFNSSRTISLSGDVSGSASGDGSSGWSITTIVADNSHNHDSTTIVPIETKTYTGWLGTSSNNAANDSFYFMKMRPTDFYGQWKLRYRITASIPNQTNYYATSDITFYGYGQAAAPAIKIFNTHYSTSYRPYYYHNFYRLTSAGYTSNYSNAIGLGLRGSNSRNTAGYERTVKVEILETYNCTYELLEEGIKWANWTGNTSTNYAGLTEHNGYDNGLQETGDANSNTYDRRYLENVRLYAGTNGIKQYSIVMQDSDGRWQSFTTTDGNGVTHTKNTVGFKLGPMFRYAYSNNIAAGSLCSNNYVYETGSMDFRYATNCAQTLTVNKSVYIVGTMNDGYFYLDDVWYTQTLPTTEDGKVYIYFGETRSAYEVAYTAYHPVYQYKNGAMRLFVEHASTTDSAVNAEYLTHKTVNNTSLHNTTGTFAFSGSGDPWSGTDWVGLQVGDSADKFQITANGNAMLFRQNDSGGTNASWADWVTMLSSANYNNYAPSLTGTGASGTWGISISGTAAKATADANGATISSTYLKLSGGTMTGGITFVGNQSSAWNNKGIVFTNGSRIGESSALGIYSAADVVIRPNSANEVNTTDGIKISADGLFPTSNNTENLGLSGNKWANVYATTFNGNATSATKATQDGNGAVISSTYAKLSGAAFTGAVTGTSFAASSYLAANSGNSGTAGGLALYSTTPTNYGITMRTTTNQGRHGYVQDDWATYFCMQGTSTANGKGRGWIFKNTTTDPNAGVASISGAGNGVFNGSVTIGGNATNTSGMCMEYDATLGCTNFVFN